MKTDQKNSQHTIIGTGLIALDIVYNEQSEFPITLAGGTCGNVLTGLAFLGWDSHPIARFSNHKSTDTLINDLSRWGVKCDLITRLEDGSTPLIIQRIYKDRKGNVKHKFEFKCPTCNSWLPSYKPVLRKTVDQVINSRPETDVFFFDRINRAAIELAIYYKSKGALIVMEPSSIKEEKILEDALSVVDIIKFSSDRITNWSSIFPTSVVPLEIETLGKDGLRYRSVRTPEKWFSLSAFSVDSLVDAAGAGDWCTIGLLYYLKTHGLDINSSSRKEVERALVFGQALASINCQFEGARGIMYNLSKENVFASVNALLDSKATDIQSLIQPVTHTSLREECCSMF
jgi:sugar/nucleoside kinase (ribokinase family)